MTGQVGSLIGIAGVAGPIGGEIKVLADGGATARGSLENFIGFGKSATCLEPTPNDFSDVAKHAATEAATGKQVQEPIYGTAANGAAVLTWTDKAAGP